MARKTPRDLSPEDQEQAKKMGEQLRLIGVREKEPTQEGPAHTPAVEKAYWSERGRARDLQVEKDGHTEQIRFQGRPWTDRLENLLANRAQGMESERGATELRGVETPEAKRSEATQETVQEEQTILLKPSKSASQESNRQSTKFQDRIREEGGTKANEREPQGRQAERGGQEREHEW